MFAKSLPVQLLNLQTKRQLLMGGSYVQCELGERDSHTAHAKPLPGVLGCRAAGGGQVSPGTRVATWECRDGPKNVLQKPLTWP